MLIGEFARLLERLRVENDRMRVLDVASLAEASIYKRVELGKFLSGK